MFEISIYLETTIKGPNKSNGAYGYVIEFLGKDLTTREAFSFVPDTTANQINLIALTKAISILTKPCQITVYTNSSYVCNTINQNRVKTWSLKEWTSAKGKEIKNKTLWQLIGKQLDIHTIHAINTKNHVYTKWMQTKLTDVHHK